MQVPELNTPEWDRFAADNPAMARQHINDVIENSLETMKKGCLTALKAILKGLVNITVDTLIAFGAWNLVIAPAFHITGISMWTMLLIIVMFRSIDGMPATYSLFRAVEDRFHWIPLNAKLEAMDKRLQVIEGQTTQSNQENEAA